MSLKSDQLEILLGVYKSTEISEKEMQHDTLLRRAITNMLVLLVAQPFIY